MKTATLNELKKELSQLPPERLLELSLCLAKYSKENKELLTYLLFEAHNEDSYINNVKKLIDEQFAGINLHHVYLAKKTIRKVLRTINKYIKYSKNNRTEVELRIYFCVQFKETGLPLQTHTVLANIYIRQIEKIKAAVAQLHEDLQSDYEEELKPLITAVN